MKMKEAEDARQRNRELVGFLYLKKDAALMYCRECLKYSEITDYMHDVIVFFND